MQSGNVPDQSECLQDPDKHHYEDHDVEQAFDCPRHRDVGIYQPHHQPDDHQNNDDIQQGHC